MKQLPDEKELAELVELARIAVAFSSSVMLLIVVKVGTTQIRTTNAR